ncbi:hypothetical protein L210DRAFT_3691456 [Boletus edulis BED1]|uniref:Uncharacterized protein n=1 Tax=Boletus edulis BED1 TaxID=1328754 RepID=A0AAD4BP14_BOLED|nr:hypothetical protein L210DRAFT_3691456 [Boletus edulis BED1]
MATFFASISPHTNFHIDARSPDAVTGPSWDVYRTRWRDVDRRFPGTRGLSITIQCFYDGPRPENDSPFAELLEIDHKTESGGGDTVRWQSGQSPANDIIPPKRTSGVLQPCTNYQTPFINEALDAQDVQVDKIESPAPPAYSYMEVEIVLHTGEIKMVNNQTQGNDKITHGESRIAPLAGNGRCAGGRKSPRMLDSHSRSARTSDGDVQMWAGRSGSMSLVREVGG